MEVYIRNKWVSLGGSSVVKDVNENDVLKVKGKIFTFTKKKFVCDMQDNPLYIVRNKFWVLFVKKAFILDKDGNQLALIKRKFFSVHDRYFIESSLGNFEVIGNILGFDYHIKKDGVEIGHISRKISLRDSFVLSVPDDVDLPFYVAFVIAIDNITDRKREDSSVSFGSSND
ncbi:MAG: LURP-one-related family protein [Bacilli bacterium]|nr:LURP-one-related family protein [Bacilli bacterium]